MRTKLLMLLSSLLTLFICLSSMFLFSSCGHDDEDMTDEPVVNADVYLSCPDDHHPHKIDLALPSGTKWACCNIGANSPEEYGGYYSWGDTEEKSIYDSDNYAYNRSLIGDDIAGTQYDVAYVKWGDSWCMPSLEKLRELADNCIKTWTTQNGVNGQLLTGSNGGTIFLPAAGIQSWYGPNYEGKECYFWSSSFWPGDVNSGSPHWYQAYSYYFYSENTSWNTFYRYIGFSVRAICR